MLNNIHVYTLFKIYSLVIQPKLLVMEALYLQIKKWIRMCHQLAKLTALTQMLLLLK